MTGAPGAIVVGTGFGCWTHLRALRVAGYRVDALVGRDPQKTEARADRFEVPVATTSLLSGAWILLRSCENDRR